MSVHNKVADLGRTKDQTLIFGEPAKPIHKAISIAWKRMGGTTYGLHHGHAVGELALPDRTFHEFFAYDKFICPNREAQKAFANDVLIADPSRVFCKTEFVSMTDQSKSLAPEICCPSINSSSSNESVLIMGFPMNCQIYYRQKGLYWSTQLDLQIRVAKALLSNGIRVEYKVHPERRFPVTQIMRELGINVIDGKVEDKEIASRCVVITYCASSTFPYILKKSNRVIYINSQHADWRKNHLKYLEQQCRVIKATLRSNGSIHFDTTELIDAIRDQDTHTKKAYSNKYYQGCWF